MCPVYVLENVIWDEQIWLIKLNEPKKKKKITEN